MATTVETKTMRVPPIDARLNISLPLFQVYTQTAIFPSKRAKSQRKKQDYATRPGKKKNTGKQKRRVYCLQERKKLPEDNVFLQKRMTEV
jgi:hypothetical protein